MATTPRRERICDGLGFLAIALVLADYVRPALLFAPGIAAGGDTQSHYATFVWFHERLLPALRLHGWYPGAFMGHPLLLYYFPLPFLLMSALAPLLGMPVAFKVGAILGALLLPGAAYAAVRLLGFRFPAPLLAAGAALVFLLLEDNPIWGGTLASTLSGEFAYAYGTALALLTLGVGYRAYSRGQKPWATAALLALTALAHGYAVLWAGFSLAYLLIPSRRPARTLLWLSSVAAAAFALAGITLVPLIAGWGWTTPYSDSQIEITLVHLFPPLLWPFFGVAALALASNALAGRRAGGADQRLLFLGYAALVAAGLAAAGTALGLVDVRFVPFAQLAVCLLAAAALGSALARAAAPDLVSFGLILAAILWSDGQSRVLRSWTAWSHSGLEAKDLAPAFRRVNAALRGGVSDPRVAVEYGTVNEGAGSLRIFDTLPCFSGRSTLEGVYSQASVGTHAVYYLLSLLGETSPNPFKSRDYGHFDPDEAMPRLRLFAVGDVVAVSPSLADALDRRADVLRTATIHPYTVFHLREPQSYVEPLRFTPVRSPLYGWRDKAYRWFTRTPLPAAFLVFTDDPRFTLEEPDEWLPPPAVPLEDADTVVATALVEPERILVTTNRVGHPLLLKVSYHPRWRAENAEGPYLVSPGLMLVVPRAERVTLTYAGRDGSDAVGLTLSLGALALIGWRIVLDRRASRRPQAPRMPRALTPAVLEMCEPPPPPRRWGWALPASLVAALLAAHLVPLGHAAAGQARALERRAEVAYRAGRFEDASEYARQGLRLLAADDPGRTALAELRKASMARVREAEGRADTAGAGNATPPPLP
jgi:Arc/MetJ-type ribon-helix-helix transcriptional regulator